LRRGWTFRYLVCGLAIVLAGYARRPCQAGSEQSFALEELPTRSIVALRHEGPYWTVRRRLNDVVAYMRAHGESGPLLIRYGADPIGPSAASLVSEVGFVADERHDPEAPFRRVDLPAESVVTGEVDPAAAVSPRKFQELERWGMARRHVATGPMTELYPGMLAAGGREPHQRRVILQVAVESAQRATPGLSGEVGRVNPGRPPDELPGTGVPKADLPKRDPRPATSKPKSTPPEAPTSKPQPKPVAPPSSTSKSRPEKPARVVDDGTGTIADLVAEGRFDAAAERLFPADRVLPDDVEWWLGQVVFRIKAAAKGMERVYPGEGDAVRALAEALQRRLGVVSERRSRRPLAQSVVRVDPERRARSTKRQRAPLLGLDRLLARIAFKSVTPEEVIVELGATVTEVARALEPDAGSESTRN